MNTQTTAPDSSGTNESINKSIVRATWIMRGILIAALLVAVLLLIICGISAISIAVSLGIAIAGGAAAFMFHLRRKRILKYTVVSGILQRYFGIKEYHADRSLPDGWLDAAGFSEKWSRARVSDYFLGIWKNITFEFGDLTVQAPALNNKPAEKLFSGQIYRIRLPNSVRIPIMIIERPEMLTQELLDARRNSDRFLLTQNDQFDRQFELRFGNDNRSSGIVEECCGMSPEEQKTYVHTIIDPITAELIEADRYATSQTTMRAIGDYLYIMIANDRDTFEYRTGDEFHIDLMISRFNEEAQAMASYLDMITQCIESHETPNPEDSQL